jgi:TIR domain/Pentapeptide repeats (8 copies)
MANEEHLARLKQGVATWNAWRDKNRRLVQPDLGGADLFRADLREANLRRVDLDGADLREAMLRKADLFEANLCRADLREADLEEVNLGGANLHEVNLVWADLAGANLFEANLSGANLSGAVLGEVNLRRGNLSGAKLAGADLRQANLFEADLGGADFHNSRIGLTVLGDVDLSSAQGLDTVNHDGPSTIGIDTLYRSQGNIPEAFLRGAGVPDEIITYAKSLVGRPFEFYSCFISYSSRDQEFAERLHADLQDKGVRCWFAPKDTQGGRKLHEQIDQAIRVHERLLLILSVHSMQSEWVKTEIAKARQREVREKWQVLFPVRLVPFEAIREWKCFDADTGKDSAREIREYFIPDFSNWKNDDAYQAAFRRLLRDLKPNTILL